MKACFPHQTGIFSGFLYLLIYLISRLPMPVLYGFSSLAYHLAYHLLSYRKMVVIQNISRAFPEKKYGEIKIIVSNFYRSFCDNMVEILKAISATSIQQKDKIKHINFEPITNHIKAGKHVIASMGHCGNWELLNIIPFIIKLESYAVYKPLSAKYMDRLLLKIRSRFGMNLITDKVVIKHLLTNPNPSIYFFLADQSPTIKDESSKFMFLHQPTYLFKGVEKLARKTNACVFYLHVIKIARGRYQVECKEISTNSSHTADKEISQNYIRLLEQNIRENPSGWLWSHKRWKG
ncbi:MAG: lysophospholipid acyltransferase family protein [Tannerellaceae bacterium]|jgi:KDO2-lipid IV(A) lauroyltransferase|nr:lysophospholipid acyltransferase family protein [Tannerellaceae bacterium]